MVSKDLQASNGSDRVQEETLDGSFALLLRHRKFILAGSLGAALLVLIVVVLIPNWYSATARIMPPQQSQSNAVAILGQLGALTGGASQALGLRNPSDVYVTMLKSRTVADALIQRFDLKTLYGHQYLVDARKTLARYSTITAGREGIITIEVDDKDAQRAADIANAYVEELRNRTLTLAVSEAAQRRLFFEAQLKKAKGDLASAEVELKEFSQRAGLVSPQGQVSLTVAAAAALRAQITAKEIQLTAMRSFATNDNPELKRTQQELSGLRAELAKMEKDVTATKGDGNVMVPFGKASEVGLEYTRRFRDMKYQETLFEVLARQYEIARIDEAKDATLIQVLDIALAPDRKTWPPRAISTLVAGIAGLVLSILVVLLRDNLERHHSKLLEQIRTAIGLLLRRRQEPR